jgi:hypothetical protein
MWNNPLPQAEVQASITKILAAIFVAQLQGTKQQGYVHLPAAGTLRIVVPKGQGLVVSTLARDLLELLSAYKFVVVER